MQSRGSEGKPAGSAVHYDIYPQIFEYLLDENMNYSSGVYPRGDEDLGEAQIHKMRAIANFTDLREDDEVLDLGCGWGGPGLYFAENYGCRVTGVNLSPVQRDYANAWAQRRGLAERFGVQVCDVHALPFADESFDKIMFLESIIHMPDKEKIFQNCFRLLKPGGRVFVQESCYDRGSLEGKYRADGGYLEFDEAFGGSTTMVSGGQMLSQMEEAGLLPLHLEEIGQDYVRTLSQWLRNLDANSEAMREISKEAYLMLRRYLMIALGTYRSRHTLCHQITAQKPKR